MLDIARASTRTRLFRRNANAWSDQKSKGLSDAHLEPFSSFRTGFPRYLAIHCVRHPGAADRLLLRIDSKLELYAANPGMGTKRDVLAPGLRSFPVGNYLVFYRVIADGI